MSEADRKKCEEWCKDCEHIEMCKWYPFCGCDFRLLPKPEQPTINSEVHHGRWISIEYDSFADGDPVWDKWECSECGHGHSGEEDTLTAFCPDCGSKMDATDTNVGGEGGADNG